MTKLDPVRPGLVHRGLPALTAAAAAVVYAQTLAPGLSHTDSGELAGVLATFGVAHPTGYPLFTLVGGAFLGLPLPGSPVWRANLLCLLFVVAAVAAFTAAARTLVTGLAPDPGSSRGVGVGVGVKVATLAAASGALLLAFSRTFWQQSTSVEVYSLQALILGLVLWTALRAHFAAGRAARRPWLACAAALGLGFANHMTTVLVVPGVLVLLVCARPTLALVAAMAGVCAAVGVPLYAWMLLRAGSNPVFNWGDPSHWANLLYHVSGRQFSVWMFDGGVVPENLVAFLTRYPSEYAGVGLVLALAGLVHLGRREPRLAVFTLVCFATTVGWVSFYRIDDLEPYFLLAHGMTGLWMAVGVAALAGLRPWLPAVCLALVPVELAWNFRSADQSELHLYEDYARSAVDGLPQDAIVVTGQWSTLVSQAWYLRLVEGLRPDVEVLGFTLLRDRFWFDRFLERNHPAIHARLRPEIEAFYPQLAALAHGREVDRSALARDFDRLLWGLEAKHPARPVYLTPELIAGGLEERGTRLPPALAPIPEQYFYRLVPVDQAREYRPLPPSSASIPRLRFPSNPGANADSIRRLVAHIRADRARYELMFGRRRKARALVRELLRLEPDYDFARAPELVELR